MIDVEVVLQGRNTKAARKWLAANYDTIVTRALETPSLAGKHGTLKMTFRWKGRGKHPTLLSAVLHRRPPMVGEV